MVVSYLYLYSVNTGSYKGENGNTKYLHDAYLSSYTSALSSLLNTQSGKFKKRFKPLVVGDTKPRLRWKPSDKLE